MRARDGTPASIAARSRAADCVLSTTKTGGRSSMCPRAASLFV
jgi:hypothetical protein